MYWADDDFEQGHDSEDQPLSLARWLVLCILGGCAWALLGLVAWAVK